MAVVIVMVVVVMAAMVVVVVVWLWRQHHHHRSRVAKVVGGRQHGGFEWASRALSLRWFISDSAQIMEYQGACTEALLVYAHKYMLNHYDNQYLLLWSHPAMQRTP